MTHGVPELSLPSPKERRGLREAAALTHEEIAAEVGASASTVRAWESGRTDPRGRKREAYARVLSRLAAASPAPADPPPSTTAPPPPTTAPPAPVAPSWTRTASARPRRFPAAGPPEPSPRGPGTVAPVPAAPPSRSPAAAAGQPPAPVPADAAAVAGAAPRTAGALRAFAAGGQGRAGSPSTRPKAAVKRAAKPPVALARHEAKTSVKAGAGGLATLGPGTADPLETSTGSGSGSGSGSADSIASTGHSGNSGHTTGPGRFTGHPGTSGDPDHPDHLSHSSHLDHSGPTSTESPEPSTATAADPVAPAAPVVPLGLVDPIEPADPTDPAAAFDALYTCAAPSLTRQAYLLTSRRALAREAVERAFHHAWAHWPEVATDPDPVGWVRAATYEYALSPWHRLRRAHRRPDEPPVEPADRILLDAMLALHPVHRRTVLLYDGIGLDLPDTAAETEATTSTTGNRLLHAHADLADLIPDLADVPPSKQSALLHDRFGALTPAVPLVPRPAAVVRVAAEQRTRLWTRAVLGLTAMIAVATTYTLSTAPTQYDPPPAPGANVSGVPPHSGPQRLTEESRQLHDKLDANPAAGPRRIMPRVE